MMEKKVMLNKKAQSVINLYSEMKKAINDSTNTYAWLISKCDRQENLAKLKRKGKGIEGMSLNSFKKYCTEYIQSESGLNGFEVIENLRKELAKSLRKPPLELGDKDISLSPLEKAKRQIDNLQRNQAILVRAYNDLNRLTLDLLANSNGNTLEYDKHKKLYADYFGLKKEVDNEE